MNWYKIAQIAQNFQELGKLRQLATQFRLEQVKSNSDEYLRERCLPTSRDLTKLLISNGYNTAIVTQGLFRCDRPSPYVSANWKVEDFWTKELMEEAKYTPLHYWVEVLMNGSDIIVDLTATQFNDELDAPVSAVEIGTYSDLGRYKAIQKDYI